MDCQQAREEIGDILLREELSNEDIEGLPKVVRDHAETCPRCAPLLEALGVIARREYVEPTPTPDLSRRVVDSLNLEEAELESRSRRLVHGRSEASGAERTDAPKPRRRLLPRVPTWAVASAAAILLVLLSVTLTTLVLSPRRGEPEVVIVRLELRAPDAEAVSVVGDWNGWNPDQNPMSDEDGDGVWHVEIKVVPDKEYQYQFYVNRERWIADPDAPLTVDDGFGGKNSVLNI